PFVRTALVLYGGLGQTHPEGCYPVAEAARFHLLETSAGSHAWGNWCEVRNRQTNDAYGAIKRLNPGVKILPPAFPLGEGFFSICEASFANDLHEGVSALRKR
ncbi:MAG: hypothetical protein RMI36_11425, partial [Thermus sp.]|uniref:hypothetical protein n=1 Tax=Thermus sp. TaxID=275 RepID=UPI00298EF657